MSNADPVAIVLAAGKSTRMKSDSPKVLHELCGQPVLHYVIDALQAAGVTRKLLVVGFMADMVKDRFASTPGVEFVMQHEQKGTGHAVMVCADALAGHVGPVVVIAGDQPMLRPELVRQMLERRQALNATAFLASAMVKDPFGLGRVLRDANGAFIGIVEQRDATPEQALIREINPSFYVFDGPSLFRALKEIRSDNAQKELYLTDAPGVLRQQGDIVAAEPLADETDMYGINNRRHLAEAHRLLQERIQGKWMDAGVTIVDPRNTSIDARAVIGRDTVIHPFSVLTGSVVVGAGCRIGPFAHLRGPGLLPDGATVASFVEWSA